MTTEEISLSSENSENIFESQENEQGFMANLLVEQTLLSKILKSPFNIDKKDVFKTSIFDSFKRKNLIYYHVSTKEFHVDARDTAGKVYLPLITREEVNIALSKIKPEIRKKINMVHFGAIKILLKAEFMPGIDYPVKMALIDNRINSRKECILGAAKGNLAYQNFMFTVYPKFGVALNTKNLDQILSFVHEAERKDLMNHGDKIFSITYVVAYALTNSHHSVDYKQKEFIELDDVFSEIGSTVPKEFVNISNDNDNWTIDISKEKPRIGQPPKQSVFGNQLKIGESSNAQQQMRSQSSRYYSNNDLLLNVSEKVNLLTKILEQEG